MLSMESSRSRAYSCDLRWRMVHHRCLLGLSYTDIGKRLRVDPSTVRRTVQLFEETGDVFSIQGYHERTTKKISYPEQLAVIEAVLENPSIYLHELQPLLSPSHNIDTSTLSRFLKQQGFSHKKLKFIAQQRNYVAREQFISDMSLYESHMLVFVDESGADKQSSLCKYGHSPIGTPAIAERMLVRGTRHNAIAAICTDGVVDVHITTSSVN